VLLPPTAQVPLVLGGSGAALWGLLDEPIGVDELVRVLARRHNVGGEALREDVERALAQMSAHGLLEELA